MKVRYFLSYTHVWQLIHILNHTYILFHDAVSVQQTESGETTLQLLTKARDSFIKAEEYIREGEHPLPALKERFLKQYKEIANIIQEGRNEIIKFCRVRNYLTDNDF